MRINDDDTMTDALSFVMREIKWQDGKFGTQNHSSFVWLAILMEEVGELSQAALHDKFGGEASGNLKHELIQVAAVSLQWLKTLSMQ